MTVQYILGIDGGGTKTLGRLQHIDSGDIFEQLGGQSSLTNDFEGACVTIMQLIESLMAKADCKAQDIVVVMGLAGGGNQSQVTRLKRRLALPFAALDVYNDARTSLFGANNGEPVAMVALGTGSVGARLDDKGKEHYVGGWGFPIGDEGGGAKLGYHGIQILLRELDDFNKPKSKLGEYLMAQLGPKKDDILNFLRNAKPAEYAKFSHKIFDLANSCYASWNLVKQHAEQAEALIRQARAQQNIPVVLMGGLAEPTYKYLSPEILDFCQLQVGSSIDGACLLAKQKLANLGQSDATQGDNSDSIEQDEKAQLLTELNQMVSEERNPNTMDIDQLSSEQILKQINHEDAQVANAITPCLPQIAQAVDYIVEGFQNGGRLVYIGAGTSGRLGILDAVECPPTFSVNHEQVVGIIAGGNQAIYKAVEGAEDSTTLGQKDLEQIDFGANDVLVGIAASGRTPYVIGALDYAKSLGAKTVSISCNPGSILSRYADANICPVVGPEVLTGSTRMKSGTAQKLVLNMLSTAAMIRNGKSYQNLMVDVNASNEKLYARAIRIVMQATECDRQTAETALENTNYKAKLAILHILTGADLQVGERTLEQHGGFLRPAILELNQQQTADIPA